MIKENIWFTSDHHFNHDNIRTHCNRPFKSVEDMNEALITLWNAVVRPGDIVYHLGDFAWRDAESIIKRLNGEKYLIEGSHDDEARKLKKYWRQITPMKIIKVDGQTICMTHCAMRVWERSHYGAWHLFGHSHGFLSSWGKSFDVGVDAHSYCPWSYAQVAERMGTLEYNHNDSRYLRASMELDSEVIGE